MARRARSRRLITRSAGARLYDVDVEAYVTVADFKNLRADGHAGLVRHAETGPYVTEIVLGPDFDA